jgi:hypothetical protein
MITSIEISRTKSETISDPRDERSIAGETSRFQIVNGADEETPQTSASSNDSIALDFDFGAADLYQKR